MMICEEHRQTEGTKVYPGQECPWCERDRLLLQIDELKLDLKESSADADALILLSKGLYERIQGKPDWVVASSCQTALNYIDYMNRLNVSLQKVAALFAADFDGHDMSCGLGDERKHCTCKYEEKKAALDAIPLEVLTQKEKRKCATGCRYLSDGGVLVCKGCGDVKQGLT